jgi:hypothetical protein
MLNLIRTSLFFFVLAIISFAMASSKAISHSYILSLNADVAANARDSIVEALKQNGATVSATR